MEKIKPFYQQTIELQFAFIIPEGSTVLELGCSTGDLLNAIKPSRGIGVDFSPTIIEIAREKYPHLEFHQTDVIDFTPDIDIDYIIVSDLLYLPVGCTGFLQNGEMLCKTTHQDYHFQLQLPLGTGFEHGGNLGTESQTTASKLAFDQGY